MVEANQQNAQKSTGPRTPEGKQRVAYNALKHGFSAQPTLDFMVAARENPAEYLALRQAHKKSFHPFTGAQEVIVDEITLLRWVRRRNQRGQAGAIALELEQLDVKAADLRRQYDHDGMGFDRQEVEDKGLINMPDCPAKFEQIRESLAALLEQVMGKEFKVDASPTLKLLYGNQPSLRGNYFYTCFGLYLINKPNAVEFEQLRVALIKERKEWTEKYLTFIGLHVEISPARRNLCFAPTEAKWRLILRQEAQIDRQIERKTRLLWDMQKEDLRRRRDPEWQEIIRQEEEAEAAEAEAWRTLARASAPAAAPEAEESQQGMAEEPAEATAGMDAKNAKQSRQSTENTGSASENKAVGAGSEDGDQPSGNGSGPGMAAPGGDESGVRAGGPHPAAANRVEEAQQT